MTRIEKVVFKGCRKRSAVYLALFEIYLPDLVAVLDHLLAFSSSCCREFPNLAPGLPLASIGPAPGGLRNLGSGAIP